MISESMKAALTAKALRNEALLFANYGKLYFEEKGLKFSGIAGIICVSRRGSSKLIKIVDIQFFKVRFELEVYSRFEEYMQQTGKGHFCHCCSKMRGGIFANAAAEGEGAFWYHS